jgi:hypothetical protein
MVFWLLDHRGMIYIWGFDSWQVVLVFLPWQPSVVSWQKGDCQVDSVIVGALSNHQVRR